MANLNDPFSDSFEEMFRRIFAPAGRAATGAPTDSKVDLQETEQARSVNSEVARTTPGTTSATVR
jgi:hypothetical protein